MHSWLKALQDLWAGLVVGQLQSLDGWNYVLLAVLVAIEGPIVTLLAAAAASGGWLRPELVFVAAAIGNLTGDTVWYSLGYMGKTDWLIRHGQRFGLRYEYIQRMEREMHTHARKILVAAKLTLSFAIPALVVAGMARVPWRKWFPAVAAAECLWTGGLVIIGYNVSLSLKRLEAGLQVVAIMGIVLFALLGARYLMRYGSHLRDGSRRIGIASDQPEAE